LQLAPAACSSGPRIKASKEIERDSGKGNLSLPEIREG
jgi:hypothetical protein